MFETFAVLGFGGYLPVVDLGMLGCQDVRVFETFGMLGLRWC